MRILGWICERAREAKDVRESVSSRRRMKRKSDFSTVTNLLLRKNLYFSPNRGLIIRQSPSSPNPTLAS